MVSSISSIFERRGSILLSFSSSFVRNQWKVFCPHTRTDVVMVVQSFEFDVSYDAADGSSACSSTMTKAIQARGYLTETHRSTHIIPRLMLPAIMAFSDLLIDRDQMQHHGTTAKYKSANTPHTAKTMSNFKHIISKAHHFMLCRKEICF